MLPTTPPAIAPIFVDDFSEAGFVSTDVVSLSLLFATNRALRAGSAHDEGYGDDLTSLTAVSGSMYDDSCGCGTRGKHEFSSRQNTQKWHTWKLVEVCSACASYINAGTL